MNLPSLFDQSKVRPMTKEEASIFVNVSFSEKVCKAPLEEEPDIVIPAGLQILRGRCKGAGIQVSEWTLLWLTMLCDSPGKCVMWAHSLVHATRKLGKVITIAEWTELSPNGVPTEQAYQDFWAAQKKHDAPSNNYLDTQEAWEHSNGTECCS